MKFRDYLMEMIEEAVRVMENPPKTVEEVYNWVKNRKEATEKGEVSFKRFKVNLSGWKYLKQYQTYINLIPKDSLKNLEDQFPQISEFLEVFVDKKTSQEDQSCYIKGKGKIILFLEKYQSEKELLRTINHEILHYLQDKMSTLIKTKFGQSSRKKEDPEISQNTPKTKGTQLPKDAHYFLDDKEFEPILHYLSTKFQEDLDKLPNQIPNVSEENTPKKEMVKTLLKFCTGTKELDKDIVTVDQEFNLQSISKWPFFKILKRYNPKKYNEALKRMAGAVE